jgi:hypothetical protein
MTTKRGSASKAFITGIICVIMLGFSWLSDPFAVFGQSAALSRLLAWASLAAAAIALIVAIYFTFRALTVRKPQKESDLESKGHGSNEPFEPNRFSN